MAKNSPVIIWIIKHNPRRDPKFHQIDRLEGAGRSTRDLFIILRRGCVLRRGWYIIIKKMGVKGHHAVWQFLQL